MNIDTIIDTLNAVERKTKDIKEKTALRVVVEVLHCVDLTGFSLRVVKELIERTEKELCEKENEKTMSEKRITKCDACGEQIDYSNGSVALMMAFCREHEATLTNVAYCKECYENLVKKHLIDLQNATGTPFGNFE